MRYLARTIATTEEGQKSLPGSERRFDVIGASISGEKPPTLFPEWMVYWRIVLLDRDGEVLDSDDKLAAAIEGLGFEVPTRADFPTEAETVEQEDGGRATSGTTVSLSLPPLEGQKGVTITRAAAQEETPETGLHGLETLQKSKTKTIHVVEGKGWREIQVADDSHNFGRRTGLPRQIWRITEGTVEAMEKRKAEEQEKQEREAEALRLRQKKDPVAEGLMTVEERVALDVSDIIRREELRWDWRARHQKGLLAQPIRLIDKKYWEAMVTDSDYGDRSSGASSISATLSDYERSMSLGGSTSFLGASLEASSKSEKKDRSRKKIVRDMSTDSVKSTESRKRTSAGRVETKQKSVDEESSPGAAPTAASTRPSAKSKFGKFGLKKAMPKPPPQPETLSDCSSGTAAEARLQGKEFTLYVAIVTDEKNRVHEVARRIGESATTQYPNVGLHGSERKARKEYLKTFDAEVNRSELAPLSGAYRQFFIENLLCLHCRSPLQKDWVSEWRRLRLSPTGINFGGQESSSGVGGGSSGQPSSGQPQRRGGIVGMLPGTTTSTVPSATTGGAPGATTTAGDVADSGSLPSGTISSERTQKYTMLRELLPLDVQATDENREHATDTAVDDTPFRRKLLGSCWDLVFNADPRSPDFGGIWSVEANSYNKRLMLARAKAQSHLVFPPERYTKGSDLLLCAFEFLALLEQDWDGVGEYWTERARKTKFWYHTVEYYKRKEKFYAKGDAQRQADRAALKRLGGEDVVALGGGVDVDGKDAGEEHVLMPWQPNFAVTLLGVASMMCGGRGLPDFMEAGSPAWFENKAQLNEYAEKVKQAEEMTAEAEGRVQKKASAKKKAAEEAKALEWLMESQKSNLSLQNEAEKAAKAKRRRFIYGAGPEAR